MGSHNIVEFELDPSGSGVWIQIGGIIYTGGPAISSGFGTSPSVTSSTPTAFAVTIGSAPGNSGIMNMTVPAPNGWIVTAQNVTSNSTLVVGVTAQSTTSFTLVSYDRVSGLATNFNASDVITIQAFPY